jgi:hypothetical protein
VLLCRLSLTFPLVFDSLYIQAGKRLAKSKPRSKKMPTMSYCLFRNTVMNLEYCQDKIENSNEQLSKEEEIAKERLIELCKQIAKES